ncbi:transporter substrate-binding domain-containing protein [Nonomuraea sp. NPDC050310]|uniref:transporter substrate-binding domain-containing protein n=1 Tax=unclassified Nonomuraea TaxID=2593643 RepID=UPI0033FB08B4
MKYPVLGLLAVTLAACGTSAATPPEPARTAALTLCTNAPYDPFEFEQDGRIVGFDVDLAGLVAERTGRPLKVLNIPFEDIQNGKALREGTCELAAAGLTITEERRERVDFSVPYFEATQAFLTRKGSKVSSLDDLDDERVGVQSGTTGVDYVRGQGLEPVEYDDSMEQLIALQTDQVDVLVQDRPVIAVWMTKFKLSKELKLIASLDTGEQYGMAVRKGDTRLLSTVNQTLAEAREDGSYERLYRQWFGTKPPKRDEGTRPEGPGSV